MLNYLSKIQHINKKLNRIHSDTNMNSYCDSWNNNTDLLKFILPVVTRIFSSNLSELFLTRILKELCTLNFIHAGLIQIMIRPSVSKFEIWVTSKDLNSVHYTIAFKIIKHRMQDENWKLVICSDRCPRPMFSD